MKLKMKKDVSLLNSSDDILSYIRKNGLSVETVAQNIATKEHPNGIHARWFRILIKRGLSDENKQVIKSVVDELSRQKKQLKE